MYTKIWSKDYAVVYQGEYNKTYEKDYSTAYTAAYTKAWVPSYSKNYTKIWDKTWEKDYSTDYVKAYTKDYAEDYSADYTKIWTKDYSTDYQATFINYTKTYEGATNFNKVYSKDYNAIENFTSGSTLDFAATYTKVWTLGWNKTYSKVWQKDYSTDYNKDYEKAYTKIWSKDYTKTWDGTAYSSDYTGDWGSNHNARYKNYGEWVKPIFPATISLQGSPPTPYIFDDRCRWDDAGEALLEWYNDGPEERERKGEVGRQWVLGDDARMTSEHMSNSFMENMDTTFKNWKPREKYTLEVV